MRVAVYRGTTVYSRIWIIENDNNKNNFKIAIHVASIKSEYIYKYIHTIFRAENEKFRAVKDTFFLPELKMWIFNVLCGQFSHFFLNYS